MRYEGDAKALIQGLPWGTVYPPRTPPPLPTVEGRSVALSILRKYIGELTFHVPTGAQVSATTPGSTKEFRICPERFFIEDADAIHEAELPAIAITPGKSDYNCIGLCVYLDESTLNKFGKGTVIQWQSEAFEIFTMEVWASSRAMRRALCAGIEVALCPTEYMYGVRFRMPDYWDETVCFTLLDRTNLSNDAARKGRLQTNFSIEMRFNVVALVNANSLQPYTTVDVMDRT